MPLQAYHRPDSVEAALALLARPHLRTVLVAGGTQINPRLSEAADEVVDLQATGLNAVHHTNTRVALGAMVRLQSLVEDEAAPELLRQTVHSAGPNTFRHQSTVGGTIVTADPESEFLAALLVLQAEVTVTTVAGNRQISLSDLLKNVGKALDGGLITAVSLAKTGATAWARVARTPKDKPIVAAVARRDGEGTVHLALCGVAPTPVLVDPQQLAHLNPPADFRGSHEYRKEMAHVLARRVLEQV